MIMPIITEAANSCSHRLFLASLRPSLGRSNKENLDLYKLLCSSTALIAMENDVFSLVSSKFTGAADLWHHRRVFCFFQHISSRRHKDRAAGKPAKPKYSPYTKPQKGQTKQPVSHRKSPGFLISSRGPGVDKIISVWTGCEEGKKNKRKKVRFKKVLFFCSKPMRLYHYE